MAFDLKSFYGYGTGALQDFDIKVTEKFTDFNSYAKVTKIERNLIDLDLDNAYLGRFEKFTTGNDILIHASTSSGMNAKIGKVICAKIEVIDGNKLTLDKNIETVFEDSDLLDYNIQAVTFANLHCLNIFSGGEISPQPYNVPKKIGGILAVKCSYKLNIDGGSINLEDCGIPVYQKENLRPLTNTELSGELDSDPLAGRENLFKDNVFPLNSGDGAVFLLAKEIEISDKGRIGNRMTHGKPNCRGAIDSSFRPSNITNIGGSSILIVANTHNIKAVNLAKYRTQESSLAQKGKGLARCYIATPDLPTVQDDKLYHADIISNPHRASQTNKIYDFGSGAFGDMINPKFNLNRWSMIVSSDKNKVIVHYENNYALADFKVGAKVLCGSDFDVQLAEILEVEEQKRNRYKLTLDKKVMHRSMFLVVFPEFENFTLTENYTLDTQVIALMASNKCTISATISKPIIIIAKNLEFNEGAKFERGGLIFADNIINFSNLVYEEPVLIFGS